MTPIDYYDVLIIGTGVAGLSLALRLPSHLQILLISKGDLVASASQRAQGGIAAVMGPPDHIDTHIADTHQAGAGLCDSAAVEQTVKEAKAAIDWLIAQGVEFTRQEPQRTHFHLTQEGGHSFRRILHAADKTGAMIMGTLAEQVQRRYNIHHLTNHTAIDLITQNGNCLGATLLNNHQQQIIAIAAKATVLATGGASSAYLHTSNPDPTYGDGIAMAWRAGCRIANLEFNQFHPTCFYHAQAPSFLISEAVRGEGGILTLPNGQRFMLQYDPRAELSSRDIVTRAIDSEIKKHQLSHVYLDISHRPAENVRHLFPTIAQQCLQWGIDITREPIPIAPAAHYTCGGVVTDLDARTDQVGLYAIGEVAYTGLHGANRMASNSLLECLVFASRASVAITQQLSESLPLSINTIKTDQNSWTSKGLNDAHLFSELEACKQEIRTQLWTHVGIIRNNQGLGTAQQFITAMKQKMAYYPLLPSKIFIELRNLVLVAELIIRCAAQRQESRGLHFNVDYPALHSHPTNTVLTPI